MKTTKKHQALTGRSEGFVRGGLGMISPAIKIKKKTRGISRATNRIKRSTRAAEGAEKTRSNGAISAYGPARSTIKGAPLNADEWKKIDAYWRASLYLCLGMLYLKENPLLHQPLKP